MAYRGFTAPLPVGQLGFTGTQNPSQARPEHLIYVDGAELDGGIIRKEGGATKLNSGALGSGSVVVSGITWQPTPGTDHTVVFLSNGDVLRDTGAGTFGTTMASGLTNTRDPPPYFMPAGGETVGAGRRLFLFSALNQVKVSADPWTTLANIGAPAADWAAGAFPTFGVLHGFRIFAGGNASDPHRIYYSTITSHSDFTGAGSGTLAVYPGEGERLVGGISFRGALILFKYPQGIYVINTSDPTPANWSVQRLTLAVGTLNQHSIVQVENDTLYMDRIGNVHSLGATNEFGDVNSSNIGVINDIPPFMRDNVNIASLRRVQGLWYQSRRQAWFALPLLGTSDNNFRLIVGFGAPTQEGTIPRFFMSRRDICVSVWLRPDPQGIPKPTFGDTSGFVWLADQNVRSKAGAGFPVTFETAATDLSFLDPQLANRSKTGQFLELVFEPRGDWDLTVEVHWDDILASIVQFDMGSGGAVLGSFILDTDVLAASVVRSTRRRISGSGRRVKLIGHNSGVGQDISLAGFHLSFTLMDERT